MPATAGRTPSSSTRDSSRTRSTRCGSTSAAPDPTHYTDVTDAVDRKIEALLSHKSQMPDPAATETMVRSWLAASGQLAGLPEGRYAEIVRVVNTR